MLSANGIDRSNTVARWIGVLPTSGASRQRRSASVPKPATVHASRRATTEARGDRRRLQRQCDRAMRHHRQMTGARMELHVGVDVVEQPDVVRRVSVVVGRSLRDHAAA